METAERGESEDRDSTHDWTPSVRDRSTHDRICPDGSMEMDREILAKVYLSMYGDNWEGRDSCLDSIFDLGSWFRVKTNDEGRVVELNRSIFDHQRSRAIPPDLGKLSALQSLDMSCIERIPRGLGKSSGAFRCLVRKPFYYDRLIGAIPPDLGKLSALRRILLGGNQLSGAIPPDLGKLSALQSLDLSRNQLN
ncbi:unnamed protein product, partial [Ascophyllum nodosum]